VCFGGHEASSGADVTSEPDGPPSSIGLPICDLGTGNFAALLSWDGEVRLESGRTLRMLIREQAMRSAIDTELRTSIEPL
jgi:hypothetical protein